MAQSKSLTHRRVSFLTLCVILVKTNTQPTPTQEHRFGISSQGIANLLSHSFES